MHRQDVHIEHMPAVAPAHAGSAVELRADDQERINRALRDARAPNTWRAYRGAWQRWAAWAVDRGHRHLPADPAAVAAFLADRAEQGAAPATVRLDRAGIAAMDWRAADLAAVLAEREGTAAGLRDAALLSLMSDALLRVSEASAADVADVARMADGSGTLTVLRSKTDQEGHVRYLGAATITRMAAWLDRAGHDAGALSCRVRRGRPSGAGASPQGAGSRALIQGCRKEW